MSTNMPPTRLSVESQLLSIMDVLVKAAVAEISQLFSESSSELRLHLTQSLKENETLRTRMKVMRSELFSLRLQTRNHSSRPASRFSPVRANIPKPRAKAQQGKEHIQQHVRSSTLLPDCPLIKNWNVLLLQENNAPPALCSGKGVTCTFPALQWRY